jgi:hypothetical protein
MSDEKKYSEADIPQGDNVIRPITNSLNPPLFICFSS